MELSRVASTSVICESYRDIDRIVRLSSSSPRLIREETALKLNLYILTLRRLT
jgi:hypothetical protein